MDAYSNGHGYGNGKGNGRYSPFSSLSSLSPLLITGHDLAALSNGDGEVQGAAAAALVRGEANLVWPTAPQAALVAVCTLQRVYEALRLPPRTRHGLLVQSALKVGIAKAGNGNGKMSAGVLEAFVRDNLADVYDAVARVTA